MKRRVPSTAPVDPLPPVRKGYWRLVLGRLLQDRSGAACLFLLLIIMGAAIFAPLLAPYDPFSTNTLRRLSSPEFGPHLLGTDELGRDLLSRLLYGGRLSLFIGFTPVLIATLVGAGLGIMAGYAGGFANTAIMRTIDVFYAFPSVLLAVAISGVLGAGIGNSILSLSLVFIPPIARVAEGVTTQIRSQDYVEAARCTGAAAHRIVFSHILPNVTGPILSYASSLISVSIVLASGLSFLGLGVTPPDAEWGLMLNTLRQAIYIAPINAVLPGLLIFATSMCFNLVSDALRSAMDVKQ